MSTSPAGPPAHHPDADRRRWIRRPAAALASLVLLAAGVSGCGNAITVHDAGQLGITLDQSGQPMVAVMTCSAATPVVTLAEGRAPADPEDQPNVIRGTWTATAAFTGVQHLSLTTPGGRWTTSRNPGALEADRLFIVDAGTTQDQDASLTPVTFRMPDLDRLSKGQVLVDGKVESAAQFSSYLCR